MRPVRLPEFAIRPCDAGGIVEAMPESPAQIGGC
jgi:hypothetical protein